MDTRFWGPSGWKLLHLNTFTYNPDKKKETLKFLKTLPFILPCKYCRSSLTDYYRQHPYTEKLDTRDDFIKWMYTIHNCVNDKLSKQGLNPAPNPTISDVKIFYKKWLNEDWESHLLTLWNFLFAIAYNHPKESSRHSKPMPNCPQDINKCTDECEKNKWNTLDLQRRMKWYTTFWKILPAVLPPKICSKWIDAERKTNPNFLCRKSTIAWLWRMRCYLDKEFKDPYTQICKRIASYSSNCSSSTKGKTCRKKSMYVQKRLTRKN